MAESIIRFDGENERERERNREKRKIGGASMRGVGEEEGEGVVS